MPLIMLLNKPLNKPLIMLLNKKKYRKRNRKL